MVETNPNNGSLKRKTSIWSIISHNRNKLKVEFSITREKYILSSSCICTRMPKRQASAMGINNKVRYSCSKMRQSVTFSSFKNSFLIERSTYNYK